MKQTNKNGLMQNIIGDDTDKNDCFIQANHSPVLFKQTTQNSTQQSEARLFELSGVSIKSIRNLRIVDKHDYESN